MKKTYMCWVVCGILMLLALCFDAYVRTVIAPIMKLTYTISIWQIVNAYITKPLFYTCLGVTVVLFSRRAKSKKGMWAEKAVFGIALSFCVLYCVMAAVSLYGIDLGRLYPFLRLFMVHPILFSALGLCLGVKMRAK